MRLKQIILFAATLCSTASIAQTAQDAVLFSQDDVVGTARFNGMGGAFSSLGGDWSAVVQNPAGLGVYRASEFSISPALHFNFTDTDYDGVSQFDNKLNLNFGNLSIVGSQQLKDRGKWRSSAFGIGLSRSATYHENYSASAENVNTSLLNDYTSVLNETGAFWGDLNGAELYPFDAQLAWFNFLVDTLPGGINFKDTLGSTPTNQNLNYEGRGAKRETYLSAGANYDDKLYIGGGFTISRIVYQRETLFSEIVPSPEKDSTLKEYSFRGEDDYQGRGIAFNAGLIYRPVNSLRISLSGRTPTWYSFEYNFKTSMNATFANGDFYETLSPDGRFDFRLRTPWKGTFGLAYIIGKFGLISADVEFIDYASTKYRNAAGETAGAAYLSQLNADLSSSMRSVLNYRFGGEYRISQFYTARAGFAHFSNPYKDNIDNNGAFQLYSIGAGFRDEFYSVDLAYQLKVSSDRSYPYDPAISNPVDVASTDHRLTLSFGLRF